MSSWRRILRSSSQGDLNDFNSYFGNFENPIIQPNEHSRLNWTRPTVSSFWGTLQSQVPNHVGAGLLTLEPDFPSSFINEDRNFIGPRNSAGRYPNFASLDVQVFKTISLAGRLKNYRALLGFKIFNVTNHFNPRDFQNNIDSASFGGFYNGVGRMYGTRDNLRQEVDQPRCGVFQR